MILEVATPVLPNPERDASFWSIQCHATLRVVLKLCVMCDCDVSSIAEKATFGKSLPQWVRPVCGGFEPLLHLEMPRRPHRTPTNLAVIWATKLPRHPHLPQQRQQEQHTTGPENPPANWIQKP